VQLPENAVEKGNIRIVRVFQLAHSLVPVASFCLLNTFIWLMVSVRFPLLLTVSPDTLGSAFSAITWLGHFSLVGLVFFVLSSVFHLLPKRLYAIITVVAASVFTGLLLIDTAVYDLYKQHLDVTFVGMFFSPAGREIFTFPPLMWGLACAAMALILALEIAFMILSFKIKGKSLLTIFKVTAPVALACVFAFNFIYAWASFTGYHAVLLRAEAFPLLHPLSARKLIKKMGFQQGASIATPIDAGALRYPLKPIDLEADVKTKPNILFLFVDSWRADSFNKETMPRLFEKAKTAAVFSNHVSGGNATRCGLFSAFYAIPATYWHSFLAAGKRPVFMETLAKRNYTFAIFASANLTNPEFDQTIFREIPALRISSDGTNTVERDVDAEEDFLGFITKHDEKNPWFGFLFYDALHAYALPKNPKLPFQPTAESINYLTLKNDTPTLPLRNLYKNATHNIDIALCGLLDKLEARGALKNTIVIITGDHGQEVNETKTNSWGHNSNYSEYQIKVPLLVFWNGKPVARFDHLTTHFNLVPTLMKDALGCRNSELDYSSGVNLFDSTPRKWFVMASYSSTAILHPGGVQVLKKYGLGENYRFDYSDKGTPLSGVILKQVLEEMRRFRAEEK
jgi:membrane-anchored protein YejM (alkaline phosphatase superfamily)